VSVGGYDVELVGGFIGEDSYENSGSISYSYSTGFVSGSQANEVGGFAGEANFDDTAVDDYWDTKTSGTDIGVGNGHSDGITGLTTKQLRAGLPQGFDPSIWGQNRKINNGLPYLLANAPPE
jgi:hypothetical protein